MQHVIIPFAKKIEPYVWWEGAFSDSEIDWLQNKSIQASTNALIGTKNNERNSSDIRRSKISWLEKTKDSSWVFERLSDVVSQINSQYYNFDITGFGEPLQLTNYDHTELGKYDWHEDYNAGVSRKLSMVLQLTDPAQYEGGNLQIMTGEGISTIKKQRGLIVVFPSYILHQVTPVTQGSRQSLVSWISGPAFR